MARSALIRRLPIALCAAGVALFAASPALAGADHGRSDGPLLRWSETVPADASARVRATYDQSGDSHVTLHVKGLRPHTEYGAHAHVNACGLAPGDAGPHFQNVPDPVLPSTDPAYANPLNEVWLDLTTNSAGNAVARATVPWQFSPDRRPRSVVLHVAHTSTAPGTAGTAGARLACVDVTF